MAHTSAGLAEDEMEANYRPNPLYQRVCDQLEQALAILANDPAADPLRQLVSDAIDEATWLTYLKPSRPRALRLVLLGNKNCERHAR
ncbi:hypothetical protein WH87_04660 [Devosia epidermidihirudinis]|uniref:Uncharacterized protein n=1 Tax=Devosia epidermidihirudinis TaxID=1293439 RepID=A0A0F5QHJ2_9HYPH|nr:hypothetical protein WH87_04660 [Devosia epidermidihirudinis]